VAGIGKHHAAPGKPLPVPDSCLNSFGHGTSFFKVNFREKSRFGFQPGIKIRTMRALF
jgi:hypothetical protein